MEKERIVPCNYCRGNDESPCTNCTKSNKDCVRSRKRFRFSKTPRFKSNLGFSIDQPWLQTKNTDKLSYIDVTPQVTRGEKPTVQKSQNSSDVQQDNTTAAHELSSDDEPESDTNEDDLPNEIEDLTGIDTSAADVEMPPPPPPAALSPPSYESLTRQRSRQSHGSNTMFTPILGAPSFSPVSPAALSDSALTGGRALPHEWHGETLSYASPHSQGGGMNGLPNLGVSSLDRALQSPAPTTALRGLPEGFTDEAYLQLQEACLMRHFVDNLAFWFDTSDRDRHFSIVVPQRAMFCPVLLYAIYTASARHLTRLWQKRGSGDVVKFDGIPLPGLDDDTPIHYHNVCINYLIEISNDPAQSYNEDALTAATILRFYEQIDTPFTGQDSEIYLNVVRAVVETQQDESFYAIRKIHGPPREVDPYVSPHVSLRHSACLIALRQEIWSVLLYRRPIQLPICPNNDFELTNDPPPADDYVWANRILVWTADVLKFCFGGLDIRPRDSIANNPSPSLNVNSRSRVEHWKALKKFEVTWKRQQPASFKPIFQQPSSADRVFPEIWHFSNVQILALQHIEIASLLLCVYDPRLPRLGLGAISAHRNLAAQIRKSTLKLCGLALSNRTCPTALVTAALGISMCGEYFEDSERKEQDAIVGFLEQLETDHAWPTGSVIVALRESWNQSS